ncbi:hypothetical protein ACFO9Q_22585 [Paenibacillus sp. GCM10023252]|uniref:hypothetical protein n=1 Tax=Paenibacillus sp. GCM10023252 TaxID=3252649 RepID=UPI00360F3B23
MAAIQQTGIQVSIYLLAGVATTLSAFNECGRKLDRMFRADGLEPIIHVIFPYGDHTRSLIRQLLDVRTDLTSWKTASRIGGRYALNQIKRTYGGQPLLLIGHSGGGVAAYQAGRMLYEEGMTNNFRIVQVGSPRVRIAPELQNRVCYFHCVDSRGKVKDPISRIGSWGGWSSEHGKMPYWNRYKYAPGYVSGIPVIGGHADYFRHLNPYIDGQSICNLDKTIDRVRRWLKGSV